jgi:2-methylisocitrate lyase-like PEP mutase family enzyme
MGSSAKIQRMRELLRSGTIIVSPGVYDGYSARLAERLGFQAAAVTGSGLANSRLGVPDIGILSLTENVEACRWLARAISIPLMADADTGYGNAVTVHHAVQYFEEAGVVGANIEDQVWPKRCGHMKGKELIDAREAAKKIEAAAKARRDPGFIINARTDAVAVEGIEGAIARARMYAAAGADLVYPDAIRTEDQIKQFVDEAGAPVSINMGFGIRTRPTTPLISVQRLQEIGVARVTYARMLTAAAIFGITEGLKAFLADQQAGIAGNHPDRAVGIEEITSLMGYGRIDALEQEFLLEEELERRYGSDRGYVVHGT